jgi:nitrite reductase/ring-hydroxylating ferredoxin subunit
MNELHKIKKEDPGFVEIGKASKISDGKMKHVEVDGKEVLIANVGGKFYAISDRCGHMNVLLSRVI